MIKVVLWDIDNTLLDFIAAERAAIRKCFSIFDMGECTDEMLAAYSAVNVRWWERLERGERTRSAWGTPWCFFPGRRRPWRL